MFKKLPLLALLFLFLFGGQAFANPVPSSLTIDQTAAKPQHTIDLASTETKATKQAEKTEAPPISAYILPGAVTVIFVIGLSGYWFVFRKRHLKKEA